MWPRGKHLSTSAKNFFPMLVLTLLLNGGLNQRMLRSRFLLWPVLLGSQVSACNCSHSHPEIFGWVMLHGRMNDKRLLIPAGIFFTTGAGWLLSLLTYRLALGLV